MWSTNNGDYNMMSDSGFCGMSEGQQLTDHAVDGAEQHRALRRSGALAQVLQHQRPVWKHINKLSQVEQTHLLQVLPLLVCSRRAEDTQTLNKLMLNCISFMILIN